MGQHPVRDSNRLRALHVRVRRHGGVARGGRLIRKRSDEIRHGTRDRTNLPPQVQAEIYGDLLVARSAGVEPAAGSWRCTGSERAVYG